MTKPKIHCQGHIKKWPLLAATIRGTEIAPEVVRKGCIFLSHSKLRVQDDDLMVRTVTRNDGIAAASNAESSTGVSFTLARLEAY